MVRSSKKRSKARPFPSLGHPGAASWMGVALEFTKLALEAQQVVAMRLARIAMGGPVAAREIQRMIAEKPVAAMKAHVAAGGALARGSKNHVVARKALRVYAGGVRANRRRLSGN